MCSTRRCRRFATAGFPIRISPDQRLYTAPRGFSQCPTSFFGTWRLGILRKPLVASLRDAEKSKLFSFFCAFLLSFFLHFIQLVRCSAVLLPGQSLCPAVARSALRPPPLTHTSTDNPSRQHSPANRRAVYPLLRDLPTTFV